MAATKFNIAQNKEFLTSQKQIAKDLLDKFQWNDAQVEILKKVKEKGYVIGDESIDKAFKKYSGDGAQKKTILTIFGYKGKKSGWFFGAI